MDIVDWIDLAHERDIVMNLRVEYIYQLSDCQLLKNCVPSS
jgi:hypothetical protein